MGKRDFVLGLPILAGLASGYVGYRVLVPLIFQLCFAWRLPRDGLGVEIILAFYFLLYTIIPTSALAGGISTWRVMRKHDYQN